LALSAPGHWLLGDYRYSLIAALLAVAVLLASFGWTRHAMLSATLLLTTPRVLFEIEQGWTEPLVLLVLVILVVALHRRPDGAGVVAGLGMAVKQYFGLVLVLLPPPASASRQPWWRHPIVVSLAVATVITAPFVAWDFHGFMNSVVWLQLREPFRLDSLSFLVSMARRGLHPPTTVMTVAAIAVATIVVRQNLPRNAAGFAAAMAIVSVAAFAFGKKAFCNYYFFVIGALMTAVAATSHGESTE